MSSGGRKSRRQTRKRNIKKPAPATPAQKTPKTQQAISLSRASEPKDKIWWHRALAWFGIITGGSTLMALIIQVISRISVSPAITLDPKDPFSTPFILSNDGALPVYSIQIGCWYDHIRWASGFDFSMTNGELRDESAFLKSLGPGRRTTIEFSHAFTWDKSIPIISADVTIAVHYRPMFLPWEKAATYHFQIKKTSSGELLWFEK